MAGSNNNNKDQGLFIILFMAIFGTLMGIHKLVKNSQGRNAELNKMNTLIREKLQSGSTDEEIIQSFYNDASNQFGKALTQDQKDNIRTAYFKERATIDDDKTISGGFGQVAGSFSSSPTGLDSQIKEIVTSMGEIFQEAQPFLKFDALFQKAKECEASGDFVDLHVFIKKEQNAIDAILQTCATLDRNIDGVIYVFNSAESEAVQKKRKEITKLKNFTNSFKSLLVDRFKIIRHIGIMYNGKNKREATTKHEADELRVLKGVFQSDIDHMTAEMDTFNNVMENINT